MVVDKRGRCRAGSMVINVTEKVNLRKKYRQSQGKRGETSNDITWDTAPKVESFR